MQIARESTALVVIDMQNGFTEQGGSMAALGLPYAALRGAIPGCQRLVAAAREAGVPVIYTRYAFQPGYQDAGVMATHLIPSIVTNSALANGSWDAEIIKELTPGPDEIVIDKSRPSGFYGTRLEPVLSGLGVKNLVLAGVTTNICVETTARDAGQRDYVVHVVSDATAEFDQARHDHALNSIGFFFGWITNIEEVLEAWS